MLGVAAVSAGGVDTASERLAPDLVIGRGMKHESRKSGGKPLDVIIVAIK
jgi:hypothetical protein